MSLGTKTDFAGRDGFHWWIGEVEDHMDPAQLGRVRVRIIGWYTGNRTKDDGSDSYLQTLPTEMLPWATVLLPTDKPQTKNGGTTTELQPGAEVLGFFLDGEDAQQPVIMGLFPKYDNVKNTFTATEMKSRKSSGFEPFEAYTRANLHQPEAPAAQQTKTSV